MIASGSGAAAEEAGIFRELSFAAALKEARAQKKIVMVDFYTPDCVPCRRMDLTTWRDPVVAAFLGGKAVSLRERRAAAERALAGPGFVEDDARDVAALNWCLGESTATLALFDSLAPGDPRRPLLGRRVFDQLLSARRYAEAADARPSEKQRSDFEAGAKDAWSPQSHWDKEMTRMNREFQVRSAAEGIEALAGAGKSDDARALSKNVLAVEDSPWVRRVLLEHLKRAGRAELLGPA